MSQNGGDLRLVFFPFMASGHMIPMVDIAKLLAARGADCTVVTTRANAGVLRPAVDRSGLRVRLHLLPFSPTAVGLPDGCENLVSVPDGMHMKFLSAVDMLREPFARLLADHRPDAVVTDMLLSWTADVAQDLGIPRLVFHGTSFFSLCADNSMYRYRHSSAAGAAPPEGAETTFVVPGLPHRVELLRTQLLDTKSEPELAEVFDRIQEMDAISYGAVVNSFYELEPEYAEHYRAAVGMRAWHVGPVSLCNKDAQDAVARGGVDSSNAAECLSWLGTQRPDSVLYVCFGSLSLFGGRQLREIAAALEASGHKFIWVIRSGEVGDDGAGDWLPEFKERIGKDGRGMVIGGWAPQVAILDHTAAGGFMTHCGWNSSLEGLAAGLPMVTWPLFAEQFFNEKLLVDLLGVAVAVGSKRHTPRREEWDLVEAAAIGAALARVMGAGEEAEARRRRARALGGAARRATEEGGSSHADIGRLVDDLRQVRRRLPK